MAMEDEEVRPIAPTSFALVPIALDRLGVAELERYIGSLRAEIARAEAQIEAKRGHRSAADGLFKF